VVGSCESIKVVICQHFRKYKSLTKVGDPWSHLFIYLDLFHLNTLTDFSADPSGRSV
jgi:hypothetical protein